MGEIEQLTKRVEQLENVLKNAWFVLPCNKRTSVSGDIRADYVDQPFKNMFEPDACPKCVHHMHTQGEGSFVCSNDECNLIICVCGAMRTVMDTCDDCGRVRW